MAELPSEIPLTRFVTLPMVGTYGRAAVHIDPIDAAIAAGTFTFPQPGDQLQVSEDRVATWRSATVGDDGLLSTRSIRGGYAATQFDSPAAGVMMLEATGHAAVYVNGQPYAGDPYAFGNHPAPIEIVKGANTLVFHVAQGQLSAKLTRPATDVQLLVQDATLPTVVRGAESGESWAAVTLVNYRSEPLREVIAVCRVGDGSSCTTELPLIDAAASYRCALRLTLPHVVSKDVAELHVQIKQGAQLLTEERLELEVVDAGGLQVHTYQSRVDHGVQSYVVQPAAGTGQRAGALAVSSADETPKVGAIVALHTDGMSARDFAMQYTAKTWAHLIVPGGRGLFPLDWEDWSRIDAEEALADARRRFAIDNRRTYVTGHGMGAHGALVLAAANPDQFAAVATTAAWPSLWTYGGGMPVYRDPSPVQAMLLRAARPSDTLAQLSNLTGMGVYLLHGGDDQQVPVEQSRILARQLAEWHDDFALHVQPGVGNWWGAETVDAPQAMDFLANRQLDGEVASRVTLATSDLGAISRSHWLTIASQQKQFATSRVDIVRTEKPITFSGTTENVRRLVIDKSAVPPRQPFVVRLDGSRPVVFRGMPASGRVWLERQGDDWERRFSPDRGEKGPQRYGGMKAVFDHDVLLVYGTTGTDEENAWSRAKAQYDAATFAYRAGGSIEVLPDTEFDANQTKDRNVVVYGNVDTNAAWAALLSTTPIQVFRGRMTIGTRPQAGDDLGFLMVRPRSGSNTRLVAAVGGTGLPGMRITNRLRYFWAGVGYPDWLLLGGDALTVGDGGILAAGYFAEDWDLDDADLAWRDLAL